MLYRPFNIIEGDGFHHVADKLIEIGARFGKVSSKEVLPVATTVSRHVSQMYDTHKVLLKTSFEDMQSCAVTCDGWTHESTNASYITVTVHYVDNSWKLQNSIIATRRVDESHTADCIRSTVVGILMEFGILKSNENGVIHDTNVYVTDNAANMKAAFREKTWMGCSGHNLNLVLSHGLQRDSSEDSGLPSEVTELISTCKQLVTLAKRSKVNSKLETTVKQCVVTRYILHNNMSAARKFTINLATEILSFSWHLISCVLLIFLANSLSSYSYIHIVLTSNKNILQASL